MGIYYYIGGNHSNRNNDIERSGNDNLDHDNPVLPSSGNGDHTNTLNVEKTKKESPNHSLQWPATNEHKASDKSSQSLAVPLAV